MKIRIFAAVVIVALLGILGALLLRNDDHTPETSPHPDLSSRTFELPGERAPANRLRIYTWNIRNFPEDDRPQTPELGFCRRTDLDNLRTVLGALHFDILGLEEIRRPRLLRKILSEALGSGSYKAAFSRGGGRWSQHVGIVWNPQRLKLQGKVEEVSSIALTESLRPGLGAYFVSRTEDGVDFSLLQVHLRATPRGYEQRVRQYHAIAEWVKRRVQSVGDEDVIIQGDFNTTGPQGGSLEEELAEADRILAGAGLRRLPNAVGCSEYWEGRGPADGVQVPALLDQVYLRGFEELETSVPLRSWLHCKRLHCGRLLSGSDDPDPIFWDVSDHCPMSFEIRDQDLDGVGPGAS